MKSDELKTIERRCMTQHPRHVKMSVRPGDGWALHGLIRLLRPETVVEIGRLEGVSSEWILMALEANKRGHLHSIDLERSEAREEALRRLAPWVKKEMVTIHEFDSHGPKAEALAEKLGTIQFLFIDGEHTPDAVEADCRVWLPHVRGYVLFHDWSFETVRVGIRRVIDLEKFCRHIASNEYMAETDTGITSHGLMFLYLPEGLDDMPPEPPGKV